MRLTQNEPFELRNFKPNLTSTNSLINVLDQPPKVLRSLNSLGLMDGNNGALTMPSKTTYLASETDINYKEYPLRIEHAHSDKVSSHLNLTTSFSLCLDNELMAVRTHARTNTVACGLLNGSVVLVDMENGMVRKTLHTTLNRTSVTALRWKPSKNKAILTCVNAEGSVTGFSAESGAQLYRVKQAEGVQLLSLDYAIDGKHFATGDNSGNVYVYNEDLQKQVRSFNSASWFNCGHTNRVFSIKYLSDDHNVLVSGGWEGVVYIWDMRDEKVS